MISGACQVLASLKIRLSQMVSDAFQVRKHTLAILSKI